MRIIKIMGQAIVLSSVAFGALMVNGTARAQIADGYCEAHMPIVQQAVSLRRDGIPIDIALGTADAAYNTNKQLWKWLRGMIRLAYEDPALVQESISNGRAKKYCVEEVRGY
jgi:hypothetical protein